MKLVKIIGLLTALLYGTVIIAGLRIHSLSRISQWSVPAAAVRWQPPLRSSIPDNPHGDSIRRGEQIFNETRLYAPAYTGARISCTSCHAEGGIQKFASPMVGLPPLFPMFNARAGHVISLQDRIQECFVRSENGSPLDGKGSEMKALVDYVGWLSQPAANGAVFKGRGLVDLPDLQPDPVHGAAIYDSQCAGCHGLHGEGKPPVFPAVWGADSFNDGAGMHGVRKMAAFVQHNMPQNRMGTLSPQQAYDVAAFIHLQPRPTFNKLYAHF